MRIYSITYIKAPNRALFYTVYVWLLGLEITFRLQGKQLGVAAVELEELVVGAVFDNSAIGQNKNFIRHANGRKTMGNQNGRDFFT